ncbi:MAG: glycosyltransferase family 1 protein [Actinobacteria bacterium]|nr:MAG: glycosyltransferase family 1 protein [Actinomycetota bacterium]
MLWCVPGRVGGSEEYFVRQLSGLKEIGAPFDITVFAPRGFGAAHPDVAQSFRLIESTNTCERREARVWLENTWLAAQTSDFDLVHHGGGTIASRGNKKTLLTIHDAQYLTYPEYFGTLKLAYLRNRVPSALRRATIVATPSAYVRTTLVDSLGVEAQKIHVVRHGLESQIGEGATSEVALRAKFGLGTSRILFMPAITHPHKNHEFVLRMLAGPWKDDSIKLVMAGGSGLADARVTQLIAELDLGHRALRIGRVGAADRDGMIKLSFALVFPSLYEGFGAPALEAMALGTPVIASNCASLPEVIGDGGLVLALEESLWAGALVEVNARRDELVRRGHARAAQFTATKSAQDLCQAYESALSAN